jgi:hypothetical protein
VLKISINLVLRTGTVLIGCALGGCASKPAAVATPRLTPAVEAIGRPALASGQATSSPTNETAFARLADAACGLSGGCLVGASRAMLEGHRLELARQANERSKQHPALPADAREAKTADLNGDGFVTLDELIAMRRVGLDDREIVARLEATRQVFTLSPRQWIYLYDRWINRPVLDWMSNQGAVAVN